jgi:RNA polymerase sigma-70 factor (ECF subfamily)
MERLEAEPPSPAVDPSDALGDDELARALAGLPAWDQEIIRLWAWEQLEPREIADVLGSTPNAVSLRLSRAKKKLAASMAGQNPGASGHKEDRDTEEQRR